MKKYAVILTVFCMILSGCASRITAQSFTSGSLIDNHTSYFDHYNSYRNNDHYYVEGTVYQGEDEDSAVIAQVTAEDETTLLIAGFIERIKGDLQLVYTADDGTQTLIADVDKKSIDAEIIIPKGSGRVHFKGNGKKAVYDFDLHIEVDDNTQIKDPVPEEPEAPEKPEIPEDIETIPAEIEAPEKEELPETEDLDSTGFPHIHDNWPENTVDIDVTGTYQIVLHLEYHEGSMIIKPL